MGAYSLVHAGVRKKLDEMLVTWKQPVPGSLDSRPVFAPEIIRPIENALIKWRTMHVQMQQKNQQDPFRTGRPMGAPLPNTPTPPQNYNRYQQPPMHNYPPQPMMNGHAQVSHA